MFLMMRLKLKMISFGPTKHQILGLDFVVPIVKKYISKERMTSKSHCLGTKMKHKRMGPLQFYIPGFQNDPNYQKQKEFLKSTEGNLK